MGLARSTRAKPRLSQIETNTVMESAAERFAFEKIVASLASKDKSPFPPRRTIVFSKPKNKATQAIVL